MKISKKILTFILAALVILAPALLLIPTAKAYVDFEPFHDYNAPRVIDNAGILSDEFEETAAERIGEIGQRYKTDVVVLTVDGYSASEFGEKVEDYSRDIYGGMGFDDYLADYFDYKGYGYGSTYSGIIMGINMDPDNRMYWFITTGDAEYEFEGHISALKSGVQGYLASGRYDTAVEWYIDYVESVAKQAAVSQKYDFGQETFVNGDFVYDDAGILSDGDTSAILPLFKELEAKYESDFILLTVKNGFSASDFGEEAADFYRERGVDYNLNDYAADFLNSNSLGGYNNDDTDQSAVIFAITKGPDGFESTCYSAGKARDLYYGEKNEQALFTETAKSSAECVAGLVRYVSFLETPEYYDPDDAGVYTVVTPGEKASEPGFITDSAKVFGSEDLENIREKLTKASAKAKADLMIITLNDYKVSEFGPEAVVAYNHGYYGSDYTLYEYAYDKIRSLGYGGENEGVLLVIYDDNGYLECAIAGAGQKAAGRILGDYETLRESIGGKLNSFSGNSFVKAANTFITFTKWKLITGHYPLTFGHYFWSIAIAVFIGAIVTLIRTANSYNKMTVTPASTYIDSSTVHIRDKNQVFVRSSVTRVVHQSSSGGSSGGGGHSHSSGSSGRSNGGGGGRF